MAQLAIVDTGCANLASVVFAFERLGVTATVTSDAIEIRDSERVVLPGVGSASAGMKAVRKKQLLSTLTTLEQPVLGICLGMQLMAERSMELDDKGAPVDCLGVVKGDVSILTMDKSVVLPHMGWNTVNIVGDDLLFDGIHTEDRFYFVHSYAVERIDEAIAICNYGTRFSAAVRKQNYFGVQFHPELSGSAGSRILSNFLEMGS